LIKEVVMAYTLLIAFFLLFLFGMFKLALS